MSEKRIIGNEQEALINPVKLADEINRAGIAYEMYQIFENGDMELIAPKESWPAIEEIIATHSPIPAPSELEPLNESFQVAFDNLIGRIEIATEISLVDTKTVEAYQPGRFYFAAEKCEHNDIIYICRQSHSASMVYTPNQTPALWEIIASDSQTGTIDNPVVWLSGMQSFEGLYYIEEGILYWCIRDSGNILPYRCDQLIGHYFEVVNE